MIEFQVGNLHTRVNKKLATKEEWDFIHSMLAVKVPGFYFSKKFRHGQWDGTRKFFNRLTGTFYTGLLGYIEQRLKEQGISYSEKDRRIVIPSLGRELNLSGIEWRSYQDTSIREAVRIGRGIIASPVNSGKTEIAFGIIQVLGLPANLLTHRINLLYQTKERMEARLGIEVGILGSGERDLKRVNIMSIATLRRKLKDPEIEQLLKETPVVISDECHRISSKTWETCLQACGAYYRFGLSATPLLRDDISNMIVRGLTGDEITTVTNEELIQAGISATPSVYLFHINKPEFPKHYPYDKAYEEGIVFNNYRNLKIVETAKRFVDKGKSVFTIVFRIAHGEELTRLMRENGMDVEFISGESGDNQPILKDFKGKRILNIISTSISDEGLDIPAMDVLILAVGDKSILKTLQRLGRGMRKKSGENVVMIVDFLDTFSPYMKKHSHDRFTVYVNMGMSIFEVQDWSNIVKIS
jgi:superfamily II DNA or RNA helicase